MDRQHTIATIRPARRVSGVVHLPGDKSISHRYALLGALADGETVITRYAPGADCASTLACLRQLGVPLAHEQHIVRIEGRGLRGLWIPEAPLDCGNSGSTMRMLAGVLAAHPFEATLTGDASLSRRPMTRVAVPLRQMGATVLAPHGRPPLTIVGAALQGIDFAPDVPSAQVKSAVLLAGLQADGVTRVTELASTRDHTERALRAFGAHVDSEGLTVAVVGGQRLSGTTVDVPGDISSAVFWAAAAAALPGSHVELRDVGLNPSRTAILDALGRAGAIVDVELGHISGGEPVGTVVVRYADQRPLTIHPTDVPSLIDELPALAALGSLGAGITVTGAAELRGKESDRITALVSGLRRLGADADELPDGFTVRGGGGLSGGTADACEDHRLAMAFSIAALGARGPSTILGATAVAVSYPGFFEVLDSLRA
jgi:3-phosphoshikimate 1-carboxyvinyltransferase